MSKKPASAGPAGVSAATRLLTGSSLLAVAFVVSLVLHGTLFAVHFRAPERKPMRDKGLEVVLVNARHAKAPEQAQVLAQANLDGGGTSEKAVTPKSPLPPQDARRDGNALTEARRKIQQQERTQQELLTQAKKAPSVASVRQQTEQPTPVQATSGLDLLDSAAAIARIEAQIDRNLEEYAKRPRKKFIGARAREYRFAQYVEDWRLKIERIGTLNYPEAARGKLYGSLLLSVSIRADGSVANVEVTRSSGHKVLDEAAMRIVNMSSPYAPFPPDISKDTDIIEIVRTWTFTNTDQVRAN